MSIGAAPGPGPQRLWLVRHPRPAVPAGLCYGRTDVPIEDSHLAELLDILPARLPRHAEVYSSPLSRCLRLASGLQRAGFASPTVDDRLREMHFGDWEGRPWSEVPRAQIDAWRDDLVGYVPPGGESVAALARRGAAFVGDLPSGGRDAIVVTHAGVIQTLLRVLRQLPLGQLTDTRIEFGQVVVLHREAAGWRMQDD
jgi:alpha-ribazole phosphatase